MLYLQRLWQLFDFISAPWIAERSILQTEGKKEERPADWVTVNDRSGIDLYLL
jgi:hypothetical protein